MLQFFFSNTYNQQTIVFFGDQKIEFSLQINDNMTDMQRFFLSYVFEYDRVNVYDF